MTCTTLSEHRKQLGIDASYHRPNNFNQEGEDHLNVSIQSNSPIGRLLDPGYSSDFNYPHLGRFKSVLTLIYWLKSDDKDDNIRMLKGYELTKYLKKNKLHKKKLSNYHAIVAYATWLRVKDRDDIVQRIKNLPDNLELLSYHTDKISKVRITTNYARNAVEVAEEVISAIKEDRLPNFEKFVTEPQHRGKAFLAGALG